MSVERTFGDAGLGGISGVVSSLPAGFEMGEVRWENGIKYRLCYNNGNSQILPGNIFKHSEGGAGPYSCTVTTVTEAITGARGACKHVTATTGTYFWGAVYGHPVALIMEVASAATDAQVGPAANGKLILTAAVTNTIARNIGDSTTGTGTTGTASGRFLVFFEEGNTLG